MAEDPIKLFATRAERYPKPTEVDIVQGAARTALAAFPIIGGSITEFLSMVLSPAVARRRDEWLKELADALDQVESKVDGFSVESLAQNDAFVSATIRATHIAMETHQQEKREYLRNALLNIAVGKGLDEVKQQIFLNAIEAFSPAHVKALNVVWRGPALKIPWDAKAIPIPRRNYGAAIGLVATELNGEVNVIDAILADLRNRGFSKLGGQELSFPQGGIITGLGVEFLKFVLSPGDLPE
jgi:hypothetical protein